MPSFLSRSLALTPGRKRLRSILTDFRETAAAPTPDRATESLPPPVARYLQLALGTAAAAPLAVGLTHRAELNRSVDKDAWWPLRSRQWMAARVRGTSFGPMRWRKARLADLSKNRPAQEVP
jgi:hypothetical protein